MGRGGKDLCSRKEIVGHWKEEWMVQVLEKKDPERDLPERGKEILKGDRKGGDTYLQQRRQGDTTAATK